MAPFQGPETVKECYDEQMEHIAQAAAAHSEGSTSENSEALPASQRTKVVVVGLGMVSEVPMEFVNVLHTNISCLLICMYSF